MTNGCYDIDGKCTNCGEHHPCRCETGSLPSEQECFEGLARLGVLSDEGLERLEELRKEGDGSW